MKKGITLLSALLVVMGLGLAICAQERTVQVEPLKARLEITTVDQHQAMTITQNGLYFRDSQGRIRIEQGNMVTIIDPAAGTSYVLDTTRNVAHKIPLPKEALSGAELMGWLPPLRPFHVGPPPFGGPGGGMPPMQPRQAGPQQFGGAGPGNFGPPPPPPPFEPMGNRPEPKSLGAREIDGLSTQGNEITRTLPPRPDGDGEEVTEVTQVWVSKDLKLPLLTEVNHADQLKLTRRIFEIQRHATVDASLFTLPAGYQVMEMKPPRQR